MIPTLNSRATPRALPFLRPLEDRLRSVAFLPVVVFLLLSLSFLAACRGETDMGDPGLLLDVAISPTPPTVGTARLIITLRDTAGTPVEAAGIVVEGNMSHAGMAPVIDTAKVEGPGRYGISEFRFTMAGDWILTLRATLPDGRWVQTREATNVVGGMGGAP